MKKVAFTLVELLVVIAVLGILMGLLLPAVNSVRESARRLQCKNNLAQIGRAAQAHLAKQGHFPSGGWGDLWIGDPDYGVGARQPGGWIYNCLPFLGLDMIHDVGKGLPGPGPGGAKFNAMAEARAAAIPLLICPARRRAIAYPWSLANASGAVFYNTATSPTSARSDYTANGGSNWMDNSGPESLSDLATFPSMATGWYVDAGPACGTYSTLGQLAAVLDSPTLGTTGVCGALSQISNIPDGQGNVFFAGEKYLSPDYYYTGSVYGDNDTCLQGASGDTIRWTASGFPLMRDTPGIGGFTRGFGSPHAAGCQFVFCDGAVKLISYQVDFATYQSLGVRNDGTVSENF